MKNSRRFITIFIVLLCLMLSGCSTATYVAQNTASEGILDLSQWNFDQNGMTLLEGEWQFYWNKLLTYKDMDAAVPDLNAKVPTIWDNYTVNEAKLPAFGYATYRLHVKTALQAGEQMGLWVNNFSSAYTLFINDELVSSNGRVAKNVDEEIAQYSSGAVYFKIPRSEFDIIIQVSNFHYARGGFWYNLVFGNARDVKLFDTQKTFSAAAQFGILAIIGLYCLAVYFLLKDLKYNLIFGLLCLLLGIFLDATNMTLLWKLFPGVSFNSFVFIWYSSGIWAMFLLVAYFSDIFKSKFSNIVTKVFFLLTVGFQLAHIFTPTAVYTKLIGPLNLIPHMYLYFVEFVAVLVIIVLKIKSMKKAAYLNLIGIVLLTGTFIYDGLYFSNTITYGIGELSQYGAITVLLIQLIFQAKRTREYHDKKADAELKFLRAQINPHFLYNSMNTFISISRYDPATARKLMADFSEYLRKSFDVKGTGQVALLRDEAKLTQAYLNIEQARFEDRIEVNFKLPERQDVLVPACMLQPIVENAVVHGILPKPEGGRIDITIEQTPDALRFSVKDNGIGMSAQQIEEICKEKTTGIGLVNISQRLYALYKKKLSIKSAAGEGAEVSWEVPMKGRKR